LTFSFVFGLDITYIIFIAVLDLKYPQSERSTSGSLDKMRSFQWQNFLNCCQKVQLLPGEHTNYQEDEDEKGNYRFDK